jgi:hypothetical protein
MRAAAILGKFACVSSQLERREVDDCGGDHLEAAEMTVCGMERRRMKMQNRSEILRLNS